jgi:hypothetical protein
MTCRNSAFVEVDEDRKMDEVVEVEFAGIAGGGVDEEDGSSTWRPLCSLPGHQTLQRQQILLAVSYLAFPASPNLFLRFSAMFCTLACLIPVQINDFCQVQELCRLWYPHWLSYLALPCYLTIIAQRDVSALARARAHLYVLYFCLNPFACAQEYPLTLSPFMFFSF